MGRVWEEEIRIVYNSPEYVRGEKSSRKQRSEVSKKVLSSWTFFKGASRLKVRHWIRDE